MLLFFFIGNDVAWNTRTWQAARAAHESPLGIPSNYRQIVNQWIRPLYRELRTRSQLIVLLKRQFLGTLLRLGIAGMPFDGIFLRVFRRICGQN